MDVDFHHNNAVHQVTGSGRSSRHGSAATWMSWSVTGADTRAGARRWPPPNVVIHEDPERTFGDVDRSRVKAVAVRLQASPAAAKSTGGEGRVVEAARPQIVLAPRFGGAVERDREVGVD
ncbi:hypothetical protein AXG93_2482s1090 [Marchantia polymorpha subsp. ruderalis]|uniref:Uncharacterized protein n=1 Tax=Marchantia polymorpha subsp. ruderalis TaxID=1480154 RepID=A0A176VDS1_MARPO|nr:hypothetical protein AXG93_2482s1090 [Marchantia polymorpha subsp. ruderalis]